MLNYIHAIYRRFYYDTFLLKRHQALAEIISELIENDTGSPEAILDIGSGDGTVSQLIQENLKDVTIEGIDLSLREVSNITVSSFDGNTVPFDDNSFDYALLLDVLHHTEDPSVLLREAKRVSKNGVIIKDHYKENMLDYCTLILREQAYFLSLSKNETINIPYNYLSRTEWKELLNKFGLKEKSIIANYDVHSKIIDNLLLNKRDFIGLFIPV